MSFVLYFIFIFVEIKHRFGIFFSCFAEYISFSFTSPFLSRVFLQLNLLTNKAQH